MKAIHNRTSSLVTIPAVVLNISKIQNESNSQLWASLSLARFSCAQYFKDTK